MREFERGFFERREVITSGEVNVVTGAFSYTGKYITQRLLSGGREVRTLTRHPDRDSPFGDQVAAFPFNFDRLSDLIQSLQGATTFYNTYWIRFPHGESTFDKAVENTKVLINAAEEAGVQRFVHISITNAAEDSPFPYFRGKGLLEKAIIQSRLSYAIVRPTVIFGVEGILINNIAWLLRRFPIFAIPGAGDYRLQPVFVEDLAEIAVNAAHKNENMIIDAVGPKVYTFDELVRLIANKIHSKARIIRLNPRLAFFLSELVGYMVKDVVLSGDELEGLMVNLLVSGGPPTGKTSLSHWLEQNEATVGIQYYPSGLKRRYS